MPHGPTQNYDQLDQTCWRPRPGLALLVRTTVAAGPLVVAVAVGAAASYWLPATRLGLPPLVWLLLVVAVTSGVLLGCARWLRRLLPLSALLRLSLVLPDQVPSRFEVARRSWSLPVAEEAPVPVMAGAVAGTSPQGGGAHRRTTGGAVAATGSAQWLLTLVGTLADHDARTRAHGERVQAYAALIGHELGLSEQDVDRLSWAALLHDVGKVHVPTQIINKDGRPTDAEWALLQQHPHAGGELVEPLRGWLGPWLDGVEQHHERWDGDGYPRGVSGEDISLAARIIAVADTYDVITTARAYKKPMSAEQARAEIARCADSQFDPEVVRAFLRVGIGRLRLIAGPAALIAALPSLGAAPAQAMSTSAAAAQTVGGQVLSAVVSAGLGVSIGLAAPQPPADPVDVAFSAQPTRVERAATPGSTDPAAAAPTAPVPSRNGPTAPPTPDVAAAGSDLTTRPDRAAVGVPLVEPATLVVRTAPTTVPTAAPSPRPTPASGTGPGAPEPTTPAPPATPPVPSPSPVPTTAPSPSPVPTTVPSPSPVPTTDPPDPAPPVPTPTPPAVPTPTPTPGPTPPAVPAPTPPAVPDDDDDDEDDEDDDDDDDDD